MKQLIEFTNDYKQSFTIITEDNKSFDFSLEYMPNQQCWFYNLTYNNLIINGQRLTTHPNFLRQFKNQLPFGMTCSTIDATEPFLVDDFSSERVKVYLLNSDDVNVIETTIFSQ